MQDAKTFRDWVKWLRRHFPSEYPVTVRLVSRTKVKSVVGTAYAGYVFTPEPEARFDVFIDKKLTYMDTLDSLLHEWAHVLREHLPKSTYDTTEDEDVVYQAIYGRIRYHFERQRAELA
jgi:hypothetical protein